MSLGVGHVSSHSESYLPEGSSCTTLLICALSPGKSSEHCGGVTRMIPWAGDVYTGSGRKVNKEQKSSYRHWSSSRSNIGITVGTSQASTAAKA